MKNFFKILVVLIIFTSSINAQEGHEGHDHGPHGGLFVAFIALLFAGVGRHWNMTALIHGFIAAVVPTNPFLFDGMLISGEYDLESN